MPSTWTDNELAEQRGLVLEAYYGNRKMTGEAMAALLMAHPCTDGKSMTPRTARNRLKEAIRDQQAHGDLPFYRASFITDLNHALDEVIDRINPNTSDKNLGGLVKAMLDLHSGLQDHIGYYRLAPVPQEDGDVAVMSTEEMLGRLMEQMDPVTLALMSPETVRAAHAELERIGT